MRPDQQVYYVEMNTADEGWIIVYTDPSFKNLLITTGLNAEDDIGFNAKDCLAKMRAGLELEFEKCHHEFRIRSIYMMNVGVLNRLKPFEEPEEEPEEEPAEEATG